MSDEEKSDKPSTTLPGVVEKVIKSPDPTEPEKAQIAVERADPLYKEIRIQNNLKDGKGTLLSSREPRLTSRSRRNLRIRLSRKIGRSFGMTCRSSLLGETRLNHYLSRNLSSFADARDPLDSQPPWR